LSDQQLSVEDVRRLYDQHGPALVAYACSFVADVALAEDVVHQMFVKLLQGRISTPETPVAYLYRAVRNTALNMRRNGQRQSALDPGAACFTHRAGDQEAAVALEGALAELVQEQREVVVMRIWSGMTLEEIASATDVSINTVASRYRYALDKLRERLKPYERSGVTDERRKSV
jgi:RNA polymerase sigma-70 factor, ECF subfamily